MEFVKNILTPNFKNLFSKKTTTTSHASTIDYEAPSNFTWKNKIHENIVITFKAKLIL